MNLSPEEIARRTAQIKEHSGNGFRHVTREQILANLTKAREKRTENARRYKAMLTSDTIETLRDCRKETEAKADRIRDSLLRKPREGMEKPDPAAVAVVLKDLRAEIAHLWARERAMLKADALPTGKPALPAHDDDSVDPQRVHDD